MSETNRLESKSLNLKRDRRRKSVEKTGIRCSLGGTNQKS